ncbi:unnamed protein product, partial [Amoebophrya sp. A25]
EGEFRYATLDEYINEKTASDIEREAMRDRIPLGSGSLLSADKGILAAANEPDRDGTNGNGPAAFSPSFWAGRGIPTAATVTPEVLAVNQLSDDLGDYDTRFLIKRSSKEHNAYLAAPEQLLRMEAQVATRAWEAQSQIVTSKSHAATLSDWWLRQGGTRGVELNSIHGGNSLTL